MPTAIYAVANLCAIEAGAHSGYDRTQHSLQERAGGEKETLNIACLEPKWSQGMQEVEYIYIYTCMKHVVYVMRI